MDVADARQVCNILHFGDILEGTHMNFLLKRSQSHSDWRHIPVSRLFRRLCLEHHPDGFCCADHVRVFRKEGLTSQ